jgi:hypothetical protein
MEDLPMMKAFKLTLVLLCAYSLHAEDTTTDEDTTTTVKEVRTIELSTFSKPKEIIKTYGFYARSSRRRNLDFLLDMSITCPLNTRLIKSEGTGTSMKGTQGHRLSILQDSVRRGGRNAFSTNHFSSQIKIFYPQGSSSRRMKGLTGYLMQSCAGPNNADWSTVKFTSICTPNDCVGVEKGDIKDLGWKYAK